MQPILIVKTARAGEYNHRYLVPVRHGCAETDIYAIAQRATGRVCGPDFLAAYRQVSQLKGGRTGEEAIILAGIDTAGLGERQKVILAWLEDLLVDLERLVTEEIDWTQLASDRMLIECETLNLWMQRLKERLATEYRGDASLPVYVPHAPVSTRQDQQPASASSRAPAAPQRQAYGLMASIGLACLIVGGIVGWSSAGSKAPEKPMNDPVTSEPAQPQSQPESVATDQPTGRPCPDCPPCQQPVVQPAQSPPDCDCQQSDIDALKEEIKTLNRFKDDFNYLCKHLKLQLKSHERELQNSCP